MDLFVLKCIKILWVQINFSCSIYFFCCCYFTCYRVDTATGKVFVLFCLIPSSIRIVWKSLNIFHWKDPLSNSPPSSGGVSHTRYPDVPGEEQIFSIFKEGRGHFGTWQELSPWGEETDSPALCWWPRKTVCWIPSVRKGSWAFCWWNQPGKTTRLVLWGWARSERPVKGSPRGAGIHFWEEHNESKRHNK